MPKWSVPADGVSWRRRAILSSLAILAAAGWMAPTPTHAAPAPLRVCADPHNLPFSDRAGQGFENQIATLMAASLGRPLVYTWRTEDQDFVRQTLGVRACDLIMGMPDPTDGLATTRPYYWSTYVLISRADRHLHIASLDDHRLKHLKIGVEAVLGNSSYSPPARLLAEDGLAHNLVPFETDQGRTALIDALVAGRVDLAAVWGPAFGAAVLHSRVPLAVRAVGDTSEFSSRKTHFGLQAMQYEISMAVRPDDASLKSALDAAIVQQHANIIGILERYNVPVIEPGRLGAAPLASAALTSSSLCARGACPGRVGR